MKEAEAEGQEEIKELTAKFEARLQNSASAEGKAQW